MKYLRKFNTEADVMMFDSPNVVLVADTKNVLYNVPKLQGVYIQHIDGSMYTTDAWTAGGFSNEQANGVAVVDDRASFVIAKTEIGSSIRWSSDTANAVDGIMTTKDALVALTDYKGMSNTALAAENATGGAVYQCNEYVFPNGKKGYLPALGEWEVAYGYVDNVNAAMALIGGTIIAGNNHHWSSTQYDAKYVWKFRWRDDNVVVAQKYEYLYARAFTTL